MPSNHVNLDYFIVAFVDILGFSNMVKSDCENANGSFKYFEVLKELNKKTREIGDCSITQFSDSVIFSLPLSQENYLKMIVVLASYQQDLLKHSIICRGAIAYGKHYKENEFMFSQALIEAFQLESQKAIYPRIIISENLFEHFRPYVSGLPNVLKERDGFYFVDYLDGMDKNFSCKSLVEFNKKLDNKNLVINEKYYWLFNYWEYKFNDTLPFSTPRFNY